MSKHLRFGKMSTEQVGCWIRCCKEFRIIIVGLVVLMIDVRLAKLSYSEELKQLKGRKFSGVFSCRLVFRFSCILYTHSLALA